MSYTRKSIYATTPATTRSQSVHLGGDPKGRFFLYCNGKSVFIRDIANPEICDEYTEHTCNTTVARFSPSGFYIASGDVQGNVRIWDATQPEHKIKLETRALSGRVNDLQWDSESKRIIVVGDGKEKYGHAFLFDTGSSVGEITGHSKVVNSVSIKPTRPYRAATVSDDFKTVFFQGPPFKFDQSHADHTRFAQVVRFSPNGEKFVTAGSDGKIFIYNGTTGAKEGELSSPDGHTGGIYSLSWSPDSKYIVTASGDSTSKIWDVAANQVVATFKYADTPQVEDQQVGTLWQGDFILSLSLSGDINYLDIKRPGKPYKVLRGHQKAITAFAVGEDKTIYSGSYDGKVYAWSGNDGNGKPLGGQGHTNQVSCIAIKPGNKLESVGMDDTVRFASLSNLSYEPSLTGVEGVPKAIAVAANGQYSIVVSTQEIAVIKNNRRVSGLTVSYSPAAVAISPDSKEIAVGGEDHKVRLFTLNGDSLSAKKEVLESNRGPITAIAYSPDGNLIAAADTQRNVFVYDVTQAYKLKINQWVFHTARVNCIAWSPSGKHVASGSLDQNIIVWSVATPMKKITIKGAHQQSVTNVGWLDDTTVVSTGQDACIKTWNVVHHP